MTSSMPDETRERRLTARDIAALAILCAIFGINTADRNMLGLLLPQIQRDIPMSDTEVGWLMGPAFVVVYSIAGVPIAWLADRTGRRNIIAAGLFFWSLVTAATGFATSMVQLLAARIALGVGEATNLAPSSALLGDIFQGRRRVMAMAVFTAGGPLSIMIFFPILGWISTEHSWRLAYPLMGAVGVAVSALVMLMVREPKPSESEAAQHEHAVPQGEEVQTFRQAAATAFSSRTYVLLICGGTLISLNYSAMLAWLPTFFSRIHGLDEAQIGGLLGLYKGLFGVIAALVAGLIVTWLMRFDERWLAWAPAIFCAVMAPAQLCLLLSDSQALWKIGLAVETVMLACVNPCFFALLITLLPPKIRATGTALFLLIFNLVGQSLGPTIVGMLNDGPLAGFGNTAIRYSLLTAPTVALIGAIMVLTVSFSMESGKKRESKAAA